MNKKPKDNPMTAQLAKCPKGQNKVLQWSLWMNAKDCRKHAKWLLKAAKYLEQKKSEK